MIGEIFQRISIWIILLPLLVGIMNFKGMDQDSRWIFLLVLLAIPPQILTTFDKEDTILHISYNLYIPLEICILYKVFVSKYKSRFVRNIIFFSLCLCLAFYLFSVIRFGLQQAFFNSVVCACNSTYILWGLLLLKQEYEADDTILQRNSPFTWYFIAILLYAPCTLATLSLYHYIRDPANPFRINITIIYSIFNILLYLFFSVGLLFRKKH